MTPCFRRPDSNVPQASPSKTDDQRRRVIWGDDPRREGGRGEGPRHRRRDASRGVAQLEGRGGRGSGGALARRGREPWNCVFHHRLPTPALPPGSLSQFAFPRPVPGYFGRKPDPSRVYFSTLENSQCRTDPGRTPPAAAASGRLRAAGQGTRGPAERHLHPGPPRPQRPWGATARCRVRGPGSVRAPTAP